MLSTKLLHLLSCYLIVRLTLSTQWAGSWSAIYLPITGQRSKPQLLRGCFLNRWISINSYPTFSWLPNKIGDRYVGNIHISGRTHILPVRKICFRKRFFIFFQEKVLISNHFGYFYDSKAKRSLNNSSQFHIRPDRYILFSSQQIPSSSSPLN